MHELVEGDQLDHYQLERVVARSGMATLYYARDLRTGTPVAIKVPHPEVESDPGLFDRFRREESIGIKVDHPGVVKVFENVDRSRVYMVMEWVEGRLLRELIAEHQIAPERAVRITVAICDALEHLHAHGVVHRDLKPENVMIGEDDRIKLIDFGIAANAGSRRLTFANFSSTLGTPDYIAPEQVKGKRGDARTDIYALGVMLYEMLTGKVPFRGANPFTVMNERLLNDPEPPRHLNPDISPQMQEIILRALERDPLNRYHSAKELSHDLLHQDEIVATERAGPGKQKKRRSPTKRLVLTYVALAAIPLIIFALLLYTAKHH